MKHEYDKWGNHRIVLASGEASGYVAYEHPAFIEVDGVTYVAFTDYHTAIYMQEPEAIYKLERVAKW